MDLYIDSYTDTQQKNTESTIISRGMDLLCLLEFRSQEHFSAGSEITFVKCTENQMPAAHNNLQKDSDRWVVMIIGISIFSVDDWHVDDTQ